MDDPVKIILKYKNNNRRIQYHIYIYIGLISDNVTRILNKIQNLSLYDTLNTINIDEIKTLETIYGDMWYTKFFNTHHIVSIFSLIIKTSSYRAAVIEKFGNEWFKKHIEKFQTQNIKLVYNYGYLIKKEITQKELQKKKKFLIYDEEPADYTTKKKGLGRTFSEVQSSSIVTSDSDSSQISDSTNKTTQVGSGEIYKDMLPGLILYGNGYINDNDVTQSSDNTNSIQNGGDDMDKESDYDNFEEEGVESDEMLSDEEIDADNLEQLYKETDDQDKNIDVTQSLIKKVLNDEKILEKKISNMANFDKSKDTSIYDENLKDVYEKNYIFDQYIFKDDTIKIIKDKICCSIKNNSKFGDNTYIMPSRQYLWCEYEFESKLEKVMLGHKWVRRNELLHIDVEPNENIKVYEDLRGNLKNLKEDIKRYGSKIKLDPEDNNILCDYENFITHNELYLIDLYNELGQEYKPNSEALKNVTDTYIRLYFPKIRTDDIKQIIDFLNNNVKQESSKIQSTFETINNDLIIENEIMYNVETVRKGQKFRPIFKENYITQSVIHVGLRTIDKLNDVSKIDLFKIFNDFIPNEKYPFVQYLMNDGNVMFKFNDQHIYTYVKNKNNLNVLMKWFENAPYGISFKVKISDNEKFMAINLNELGRIEYKTQWKEEDMATVANIAETYTFVKDLVQIINTTTIRTKFEIPGDYDFKYAFMNTIQKYELPEKYTINHNDLSEFARYFYPYVSLVIEPRKRLSKVKKEDDKSKFGTYLRYKRVSKYENQTRIEQRILYFMRNYEYTDQSLANEISKQFNITLEKAMDDIQRTKNKYPRIKQSRKVLKKLENIPKYKPPGIGIDIQGKSRDKYKIRISGVRDETQLSRVITFTNILIFLYIETYLLKKPERQNLKEKLKKLTNIAKRRNKVDEIVNYSKEIKTVKQMTQIDKRRIGFKPEKGQSQWTRACQNSGNDKKRRPQQYTITTMNQLVKMGYKLNKTNGMYEKNMMVKDGKNKKNVVLRTVYLRELDEMGTSTGNEIHYACSPDENGEHMFIGFLTRSKNPFGEYMPCCFKKDQYSSKNKAKKEFFLKCMGNTDKRTDTEQKSSGDKLYILQDTNKIQDGRFGFLPKHMDFYFNIMLNLQKKIQHHYLLHSPTGYFFKYGINTDTQHFLTAIAMSLQLEVQNIIKKIVQVLREDKNEMIFTSLNNGDIKTRFETVEKYIDFIVSSTSLDMSIIYHILTTPGVLLPSGLNIVTFVRSSIVIKKSLEKEKTRENFSILCQNEEETLNIFDPKKETILLLKENKNYYPIFKVVKQIEDSKDILITRTFSYENKKENIIHHISDFYIKSCHSIDINEIINKPSKMYAKLVQLLLFKLKDKNYAPKYQYADVRNKCRFIITNNGMIVPTHPSGTIYDLHIIKSFDKYVKPFAETLNDLNAIYSLSNEEIKTKPIGVYHDKLENNMVHVVAIMTQMHDNVPVIPENVEVNALNKNKFIIEDKPFFDKIDAEIMKGPTNIIVDDRIKKVNYNKFIDESYELFRYAFSEFINQPNNVNLRKRLIKINNSSESSHIKSNIIKTILYRIIDKELYDVHISMNNINVNDESIVDATDSEPTEESLKRTTQINKSDTLVGGKIDKFVHIVDSIDDMSHYDINNNRILCQSYSSKDKCSISPHCQWTHSGCYLLLSKQMAITFVNKLCSELTTQNIKAFELLHTGNYYVSDIVDYNRFTERQGQTIIKSSNNTINSTLETIFGKENIPKIGKRRVSKQINTDYNDILISNPLKDMGNTYVQSIIPNNDTLIRAYTNGFFWHKHKYYDITSRNLGYYSELQTDTSIFMKSLIIDWLLDPKNTQTASTILTEYIDHKKIINDEIKNYVVKIINNISIMSDGIVELSILNLIHNIPIIVYDGSDIKYVFNGVIQKSDFNTSKINDMKNNSIQLRFNYSSNKYVPTTIDVIYPKN